MIGGCGWLSACGEFSGRSRLACVLALVRRLVTGPHPQADLQRVLQPLEPLGGGRERDAETAALLVVPAGPDAQPRPPTGQHVQRGQGLGQDARVAVDGAGDQGEQLRPLGVRRDETQRGVRLQHFPLGRADRANLEEMVH
jgi:hypothetical protein